MEPRVLYEDNHVLAVDKPAGWVTQGARAGDPSVVEWAREYLRRRYQKPGNVYVGVVSRLDAASTGVLLLARTSKGAARLSAEIRERRIEKVYWTLVEGRVDPPEGQWTDWLWKDESAGRMRVSLDECPGASVAKLAYRLAGASQGASWLEVRLITGRKHQIRAQLAHRGYPVLGDRKYGSRTPFAPGIALHARRVELKHPVKAETLRIEAPPPDSWRAWGVGP